MSVIELKPKKSPYTFTVEETNSGYFYCVKMYGPGIETGEFELANKTLFGLWDKSSIKEAKAKLLRRTQPQKKNPKLDNLTEFLNKD